MVSYGSNAAGSYQVVGYASVGSIGYSHSKVNWQKSTCCGSIKFGSRCTDCPG
jgi:hypothetical protein